MQGYSTPSLLYDEGFFGRSELNFNDNGPGSEPTTSSGLLGLSDPLDRLDTASSFGSGQQAMGNGGSMGAAAAHDDPADHINGPHGGSTHSNQKWIQQQQQSSNLLNHQPDSSTYTHLQHGDFRNVNPFGLDDNGNVVMQDMLHHHHQMMNLSSDSNNDNHMSMGGSARERSPQGDRNNGVTSQWEESLQDLQSLLALHGQQHSQNILNVGLPLTPDQTGPDFNSSISSINRGSGGYRFNEKGQCGGSMSGGFPNSKFPAVAVGESDLLSLFPRPNNTSSLQQQQQLQAPAGPVSAFPSNPGFRKGSGSGPVNSSCNMQIPSAGGLYSSSPGLPQNSASYPSYAVPSLVGANYFNVNPGGLNMGNLSNFFNHTSVPILQKQQLMRAPSIIDLEQARDHCSEDSGGHGAASTSSLTAAAAKFPSSLFDSAKRGGSEGSLFLSTKAGSEPRSINHFATERQRREYLNEKYQTLRSLVPNPSKADRASIVADAIEYVTELKRTVQELQILTQVKRREASLKEVAAAQNCSSSHKRRRGDMDDSNAESSGAGAGAAGAGRGAADSLNRSFSLNNNNGKSSGTLDPLSDPSHLRSSWLQRTSQTTGTHVDVRIVHDEVTIKLTQRRRKGCKLLLYVMITLYELKLDLQHANGATIGEHDIYIFNTKILEGTSTFAGYVVTKLLEAIDREIQ